MQKHTHTHTHKHEHTHTHRHTHTHTREQQEEPELEEEEEETTAADVRSDLRVMHRLLVRVCTKAGVTQEEIEAANNGTPTPGPDSG